MSGDRDDTAPLVVKIGGAAAADAAATTMLLEELGAHRGRAVLVHGGGAEVTEVSRALGMEPTFQDGVRLTTPEEMAVVDMVLAGRMNTSLVRRAHGAGVAAVGLTGADAGLLEGRIVSSDASNGVVTRTARPAAVNPTVLRVLQQAGYLPIIASVATGEDGEAVNINADDAAQAIAEAFSGSVLVYLSDVSGVLDGDGTALRTVDPAGVEELIAAGVVAGGMAAKLRSCVAALTGGVRRVVIGRYHAVDDLKRLLAGDAGTTVGPSGES